jgi:hypothetical protein
MQLQASQRGGLSRVLFRATVLQYLREPEQEPAWCANG